MNNDKGKNKMVFVPQYNIHAVIVDFKDNLLIPEFDRLAHMWILLKIQRGNVVYCGSD